MPRVLRKVRVHAVTRKAMTISVYTIGVRLRNLVVNNGCVEQPTCKASKSLAPALVGASRLRTLTFSRSTTVRQQRHRAPETGKGATWGFSKMNSFQGGALCGPRAEGCSEPKAAWAGE